MTQLQTIYDKFINKTTDDMYLELNKEETYNLQFPLFESAITWFEFPRVDLYDYDPDIGEYNIDLSPEEIDIIATYMMVEWFNQQLASVELTRMKYSGSDFKMTSQANHMHKLKDLKKEYERVGFHLQRLYKRRKRDDTGIMRSTIGSIMDSSPREGR